MTNYNKQLDSEETVTGACYGGTQGSQSLIIFTIYYVGESGAQPNAFWFWLN